MQHLPPFCYKYLPVILSGFFPDLLRRACCHDAAAALAAARPHVDDIVRVADDIKVVFDDNDRCAVVQQGLEHPQQHLHVQRVEADAGLIENEHRVGLGAADLAGQLEALGLAAGEAGRLFAQRQVSQTQLLQCLQALAHCLHPAAERKGGVDVHIHQLRQGDGLLRLVGQLHAVSRPRVAGTPAVGADDVHIRQELHVQAHLTGAVAAGAAQTARVVGKNRWP